MSEIANTSLAAETTVSVTVTEDSTVRVLTDGPATLTCVVNGEDASINAPTRPNISADVGVVGTVLKITSHEVAINYKVSQL